MEALMLIVAIVGILVSLPAAVLSAIQVYDLVKARTGNRKKLG